jgi:hypothetical protein
MTHSEWAEWDCKDICELGSEATTDNLEAYNIIQRRELAAQFDRKAATDDRPEEIESFIEDHWLDWLAEALRAER